MWPEDVRARGLATELYASVADRQLISVHNGLPARYLAEDLPVTDPINLLVSHDQGVQALLRSHGVRVEFSPSDGWQTEASRQAFVLLWRHLVATRDKPWMHEEGDRLNRVAGLPPMRPSEDPAVVYDTVAADMQRHPVYPRRVLPAADIAWFATSDDPADDLEAHAILATDPTWAGRVRPTFSPDRFLQPDRLRWRTDVDLLAELTGTDTGDLDGFVEAIRQRREVFLAAGAVMSEHHSSDVTMARLPDGSAQTLYGFARSGELLPTEAEALRGHLLWEMARLSAEDGLVMALYPPAGFRTRGTSIGDDHGVADRVRPLLADFGARPAFRMWLFSIDTTAYATECVPLAAQHPALTAVPPTRFADDPVTLRSLRRDAVARLGSSRVLGRVDDMSGPFALAARHGLARRLDAGALAELVLAGMITESQARADLNAALDPSTLGSPTGRAV